MNFVEKMVNLGFTEQGRWEEDHDSLTRCVVRYHHFLDLMASTPGNFVVPTLVSLTAETVRGVLVFPLLMSGFWWTV